MPASPWMFRSIGLDRSRLKIPMMDFCIDHVSAGNKIKVQIVTGDRVDE